MKHIKSLVAVGIICLTGCATPGPAPTGSTPSDTPQTAQVSGASVLSLYEAKDAFSKAWESHLELDPRPQGKMLRNMRLMNGRLDYQAWAEDEEYSAAAADYLAAVADAALAVADDDGLLAIFINVYNAAIVDAILTTGEVVPPADTLAVKVAGKQYTLADLRAEVTHAAGFADVRATFGLLCFARGCTRAAATVPTEERLERWLENAERDFIFHTTSIDKEVMMRWMNAPEDEPPLGPENIIVTSTFFQEHGHAFEATHGSVHAYLTENFQRSNDKIKDVLERSGSPPLHPANDRMLAAFAAGEFTYVYEDVDWENLELPHSEPRPIRPPSVAPDASSGSDAAIVNVYSRPRGMILLAGEPTGQLTPAPVEVVGGEVNQLQVQFDDGSISEVKEVKGKVGKRLKLFFKQDEQH